MYQVSFDGQTCFPATDTGVKDITLSLVDPTMPDHGVVLHYTTSEYHSYQRTVVVTLLCDKRVDKPVLEFEREDYETGHSCYFFKMATKHACAKRSGALSLRVRG